MRRRYSVRSLISSGVSHYSRLYARSAVFPSTSSFRRFSNSAIILMFSIAPARLLSAARNRIADFWPSGRFPEDCYSVPTSRDVNCAAAVRLVCGPITSAVKASLCTPLTPSPRYPPSSTPSSTVDTSALDVAPSSENLG